MVLKQRHFVRRPVATPLHFRAYQISVQFDWVERTYISAQAEQSVLVAGVYGPFAYPRVILRKDILHVTFRAFDTFGGSKRPRAQRIVHPHSKINPVLRPTKNRLCGLISHAQTRESTMGAGTGSRPRSANAIRF